MAIDVSTTEVEQERTVEEQIEHLRDLFADASTQPTGCGNRNPGASHHPARQVTAATLANPDQVRLRWGPWTGPP
jgi:hypothetical protein